MRDSWGILLYYQIEIRSGGIRRKRKKIFRENTILQTRYHISGFILVLSATVQQKKKKKLVLKPYWNRSSGKSLKAMTRTLCVFLFCFRWRRSKVSANQFSGHIPRNKVMQRGRIYPSNLWSVNGRCLWR